MPLFYIGFIQTLKILRDVLSENNKGQVLIPQILTNSAEGTYYCIQMIQFTS